MSKTTMTPDDLAKIRDWAETMAPYGSVQARQVLGLLARIAELEALTHAQAERIAQQSELLSKRAEKTRLQADAELIGKLEAGVRGADGLWPDWVYESREAIRHQNEKLPWLPDLLKVLGWQGGTIHQALSAVSRLVHESKQRGAEKSRLRHGECDACGYPNNPNGTCSRNGCCNSD